jgi:hypothetical protein
MSGNENILTCDANSILNERQVNVEKNVNKVQVNSCCFSVIVPYAYVYSGGNSLFPVGGGGGGRGGWQSLLN